MHILWNLILFSLLLVIISQICFQIFAVFGEDGAGILQYATSEQNFNSADSILFKGVGKIFLKTCFRDDEGNLLQKIMENMDNKSFKMKELNNIIKQEIIYQMQYDYIKKIQLNDTQEIVDDLYKMYNDYSQIKYYTDSLLSIEKNCQDDFNDLNEYTDYSDKISSKQLISLYKNNTYDVWVSKENNCRNFQKYQYINDENKRIEGKKYCMVIEQFEKDIAKKFYTNIPTKLESTYSSVDEAFEEYYKAFIKFEEDNKKLLNEDPNFIGTTTTYYKELLGIKEAILKGLEYSQKINEVINQILGNSYGMSVGNDIFTVMNCWFLKRDLKVFYIEMEKLRANSTPFLVLAVFKDLLLLTAAILIIINIYKYNDENREKKESLTHSINM